MDFCSNEKFTRTILEEEIYYCDKCEYYHKHDKNNNIYLAIINLNLNKLKEIFSTMSKEELINYRYYYDDNCSINIIQIFSMELLSGMGPEDDTMKCLSYNNFDEDSIFYSVTIKQKELALKILELICVTIPELITENEIKTSTEHRATSIINILVNNYIETNIEHEACFSCFSSHSINLIDNTCLCKNKIHLECLINITKKIGHICQTCKNDNGGIITSNGVLIFPDYNIYYDPLSDYYTIATDVNTQLHFSIGYLQYKRVDQILNNITKEQYQNYYDNADFYALHIKTDKNLPLMLIDVPYTNIIRENNKEKFIYMENILFYHHFKFTEI
jgi:hypothetical protein